jgi:hypothetical protein
MQQNRDRKEAALCGGSRLEPPARFLPALQNLDHELLGLVTGWIYLRQKDHSAPILFVHLGRFGTCSASGLNYICQLVRFNSPRGNAVNIVLLHIQLDAHFSAKEAVICRS